VKVTFFICWFLGGGGLNDNSRVKVAIGSDHAGFQLKQELKRELIELGYDVVDVGTDSEETCDYPDYALKVALCVSEGEASRGVLICGTGAGMSIVANKVKGIRAALCNEEYTARYSRLHNDANVVTMGSRVVSLEKAKSILRDFVETSFEGERKDGLRHVRRLEKLARIEEMYCREVEG